jgi:hypothetical protein
MGVARGSRKCAKVCMTRSKKNCRKLQKIVDRKAPMPYLVRMTKNKFTVVSNAREFPGCWAIRYRVDGADRDEVAFGKSEKHCFFIILNRVGAIRPTANYLPRKRSNSGRSFINNNGFLCEE